MDRREADLSATVSIRLVLVPLTIQLLARLLDPWYGAYTTLFNGEAGFIELGTAAMLLAGSILLARIAARLLRDGERANGILAAVLAFGAFLVMGEEISWGQWLFHWNSPEWFLQYNDQGETNLHNLVFVKKDIPKWVVVIGIAVFGLFLPLRGGPTAGRIGPFDAKMLPTAACVPAALVVVVSHVMVKVLWWFGGIELEPLLGIDVREATEFYVALFGLTYAMSLWIRLHAMSALGGARAADRREPSPAGRTAPAASRKSLGERNG